jgi:hypothetical protein
MANPRVYQARSQRESPKKKRQSYWGKEKEKVKNKKRSDKSRCYRHKGFEVHVTKN